jgi:site-specific recombinase XerD
MNIESAFADFILAGRADGLAPKTLKWYSYTLGTLVREFPSRELESITTKELRQYIVALRERLAVDSAAGHLRALHRFFSWCADEYNIPNPMRSIKRAAQPKPSPKAITPSDFIKLFEATSKTPAGIRDRAILAFFADTGCRLGGLLNLQIDQLDLEQRYAVVKEKGSKTRKIPFTHYTRVLLMHWLEVRESKSTYVFTTIKGGEQLTESGLHEILKRLKRRAGVEGRVNPHSFRHRFALEYLEAGGDVVTLARLMGHSNIQTTVNSYGVFSESELAEAHDKRSPLIRMLEGK